MDKEMNATDLATMMCTSIDTELTIKKHIGTEEVELEGKRKINAMCYMPAMSRNEQQKRNEKKLRYIW